MSAAPTILHEVSKMLQQQQLQLHAVAYAQQGIRHPTLAEMTDDPQALWCPPRHQVSQSQLIASPPFPPPDPRTRDEPAT